MKRNGLYYAVTCHHVLVEYREEALRSGRRITPACHTGSTVRLFGSWTDKGTYRWSFLSWRAYGHPSQSAEENEQLSRSNSELPDIAIADVTTVWEALARDRALIAIDLDDWSEPPWEDIQDIWMAYGFPTDHKEIIDNMVSAPMPAISVELKTKNISSSDGKFSLFSTFENPHGWGFSGVSGGPVIAYNPRSDIFHFVGLVYGGAPSTSKPRSDDQAFLGPKDILLQCYQLSPATFDLWLSSIKHGVELGP